MTFRDKCSNIINTVLIILSRLLKSVWLFFPGILFLALFIWCFWKLGQGKDLLVAFTENRHSKIYFFLAIGFWVYVSWYSSRIVAYLKKDKETDYIKKLTEGLPLPQVDERTKNPGYFELPAYYLEKMPRMIGYGCLLAIELAIWQSPIIMRYPLPAGSATTLFFVLLIGCYILDEIVDRYSNRHKMQSRVIFYCLLTIFIIAAIITSYASKKYSSSVLLVLLLLHAVYLFYINLRRLYVEEKNEKAPVTPLHPSWFRRQIYKLMDFVCIPRGEMGYFRWFNLISLAGIIIYLLTIASLHFSWRIGPLPFVLLAFAVLLGLGNILTTLSVKISINLHFIALLLALFLVPKETHYIRTHALDKEAPANAYSNRKDIYAYFNDWIQTHGAAIDSAKDNYPVYFVLANGGASRSGYWTASVLGKLEDATTPTGDPFSSHVFCLSGTSGGGVGVATYFSQIYQHQYSAAGKNAPYLTSARLFLGRDFLTSTLAHMLGPDYFKYIFHIGSEWISDRGVALEKSLELGAETCEDSLKIPMAASFSKMLAIRNQPYNLPILCINTTRMQDGSPGVVTNIQLDRTIFNKRIDVGEILSNDKKDINLSTAAIMGARFPYISPAGRLDEVIPENRRVNPQDSMLIHYFVDGGYFDNSGAGVVQEMMRAILNYSAQSTDQQLKNRVAKLFFRVIHITNSPQGVARLNAVSPIKNDLMAPALTILGAYDMQTTVNDRRLINFVEDVKTRGIIKNADYYPIHLYLGPEEYAAAKKKDPRSVPEAPYAMNWFISDSTRNRMDNRLARQPNLNSLVNQLK